MPGGQVSGSQPISEVDHRIQAHVAVTADAGIGCLAGTVRGQVRLHDTGRELFAQIEGQMGQAGFVSKRSGAADCRCRATAALFVIVVVTPKLQRHAHYLATIGLTA
jgi:hypothetical protein